MMDWLIGKLLMSDLTGWRGKAMNLKLNEENGGTCLEGTPSVKAAVAGLPDVLLLDVLTEALKQIAVRSPNRENWEELVSHWIYKEFDPDRALSCISRHAAEQWLAKHKERLK
jgi:hypothetical protein